MAKAIWKLALDPSFHDESFNLAVDDHMVLHEFGLLVAENMIWLRLRSLDLNFRQERG
jgi:hypothetical protein